MEETRWKEKIKPLDENAMEEARAHWMTVGKPLFSLGSLEDAVIQIAGIKGTSDFELRKRGLIIMCADNGVVEEGVTQTGQEVTAIVAENFLTCNTSAAIMCKKAGVDIFPIDIGMAADTKVPRYKTANGTANMTKGPAMTRMQALQAILTGIHQVKEKKEAGYKIIATGEMGIGNTTTSSAVASVLLGKRAEEVTGRGAGLSSEGLQRKIRVIRQALEKNRPDPGDVLDVVAKVGGYDIAGMCGLFLGGAIYRIPVLIDGFISSVAALCAVRLAPLAGKYLFASHCSKEPGGKRVLDALGMSAMIVCDLSLGEGSGAVAAVPLLEMGLDVYRKMSTFEEIQVEQYQELK